MTRYCTPFLRKDMHTKYTSLPTSDIHCDRPHELTGNVKSQIKDKD